MVKINVTTRPPSCYMGKLIPYNLKLSYISKCYIYNKHDKCCCVVHVFISNVNKILNRYKNVTKTDMKASWIQQPKSAPPKKITMMEEVFQPPPKIQRGKM